MLCLRAISRRPIRSSSTSNTTCRLNSKLNLRCRAMAYSPTSRPGWSNLEPFTCPTPGVHVWTQPRAQGFRAIGDSGCVHVSGLSTERQLLQAMMEIRAFSPYHSSGLLRPEPLAGLENAGPTGSPSSDNLRNLGQVFQRTPPIRRRPARGILHSGLVMPTTHARSYWLAPPRQCSLRIALGAE
jgi:hypothetical protein